jgi:hypothetical protein
MGSHIGKVIFYDVLLRKNRCNTDHICDCTEVVQRLKNAALFRAKAVLRVVPPMRAAIEVIARI